jgi:trehalose 6-phosphate synthase
VLRLLRFLLPLLTALALLAWAASALLDQTSRGWFERDVKMRSTLAVNGARLALLPRWSTGDQAGLSHALEQITRDERIMAAAACDVAGLPVALTQGYPEGFDCPAIFKKLAGDGGWRQGDVPGELATGAVITTSTLLTDDRGAVLGAIVLVHDMSYATRREGQLRLLTVGAFVILAILASVVTFVVSRLSFRRWASELHRAFRGDRRLDERRPELQPLLADVRDLVSRLAAEEAPGKYTPERLRQTLRRHLSGEQVIIAANREPYIHDRQPDGSIRVLHPASGLVTALEPVMRACSGVWVAHGSGTADRATVDKRDRIAVPPGEQSYLIRRVWLSKEEEQGYYYGFANEGLWPLCHIADTRPTFRRADWEHYRRVNQKFADAVIEEAATDDPIIFVQDYHFALLPQMIRKRLPRATILTFWHIPWPNSERFGICPFYRELVEGLLGSSIVGFHTQFHCNNFVDAVDRFLEARIDREQQGIVVAGRRTLVRPYPISIEWPSSWADAAPSPESCRAEIFALLKLAPDTLLGVGIDRLDYTKGIEERLLAVERTLERHPELRGRFVFAQLAAPSRTLIERYRQLNDSVEALALRINEKFGKDGYQPIVLLREHHEPPTVFKYYRAADLCYVSSLHDGMNLVAKEFVAARSDERGVLVLSRFTGAARELTEALIVNPYDLDAAGDALALGLAMPLAQQVERMRAMRALVAEFNVYRWADRMLVDAARLRQHDRVVDRLRAG